jgi:predicted membrane protein
MEDKRKARPQSIAEFLALMDDNQSDVTPIPIPEPAATIVSVEPIMASEATVVSVEPKSEDEATVVNVAPKCENDVVVVEDKPMQESKPAPQSRLIAIFVALMPICTLLPWTYVSASYYGITASRLGITTWYGIAGLVSSLVVAYGVLRKRRYLTFWASIFAVVMGVIGMFSYAPVTTTFMGREIQITADIADVINIEVTHPGAILFTIVAAYTATPSFLRIIKKK